jgi:hypothetical protein
MGLGDRLRALDDRVNARMPARFKLFSNNPITRRRVLRNGGIQIAVMFGSIVLTTLIGGYGWTGLLYGLPVLIGASIGLIVSLRRLPKPARDHDETRRISRSTR